MTPQEIEELSWRMGEVYEAVVNRILVNLARHFRFIEAGEIPSGAWEYQVKKLAEMGQINRETERIILEMLGDADSALQALLEESILNGLRDAEPALRSAAEKGFLNGGGNIPPVLAPNQMQAFKAFYAQSADKLNLVNTVMLESTQAAFAATVSDIAVKIANTQGILNVASGEVVTGVSAWNKAMRDAVNKMVENGLTGYIDHAGRHWSPEAYVTMDIRSTMANTARTAVFERNEEYGNDLYQVSWHNGARPLCYPWQGKVISRTGNARVVEDDEGNEVQVHTEDEIESFNYGGGLFGVNCGHYPIPFIPNFSRIRQPMEDAEQNAKTYEESQKQRTLERKLRNEKRDLEVLKAQGASEDVLKEQRRRVRKASNDIDEFCAETGRARRRNREYTPIDPKFPDPDTYDPKLFPNDEKSKIDNWFRNGNDTEPPMVNIHAGGDDVPPTRTFTPAKTREEAVEYAKQFAKSVDYERISVDRLNIINEELTTLTGKYPINQLEEITNRSKGVMSANYHHLKINGTKLGKTLENSEFNFKLSQSMAKADLNNLRTKYPNAVPWDAQRRIEKLEKELKFSRWAVCDSYEDKIKVTVIHEYGHILSDQYIGMLNGEIANPHITTNWSIRSWNDKWKALYDASQINGDIFAVSKYGSTNHREFFAEAFAMHEMGEPLPSPIKTLLEEIIRNGIL